MKNLTSMKLTSYYKRAIVNYNYTNIVNFIDRMTILKLTKPRVS